jgi:hypothetical protein
MEKGAVCLFWLLLRCLKRALFRALRLPVSFRLRVCVVVVVLQTIFSIRHLFCQNNSN